jgi:hypothetical protein
MNWITLAVLGAVGAWFEYSYRRSRRIKTESNSSNDTARKSAASEHAQVAQAGSEPSLVPGDQNDKQMNAAV